MDFYSYGLSESGTVWVSGNFNTWLCGNIEGDEPRGYIHADAGEGC